MPTQRFFRVGAAVCALVSLVALALAAPAAARPLAGAGMWARGATFGAWRVDAVTLHPEFQRFTLVAAHARTTVELAARTDGPAAHATQHLRLQPAPGENPPEALLAAMAADLRAREAVGGAPAVAARSRPAPWHALSAADLGFALADAVFLASALALTAYSLRRRRELRPWAAVAALLVVAATAALFVALRPADLPIAWLTGLHEGGTAEAIEILHGRNSHAGPHLDWLVWLAGGEPALGVRRLVRLNVWFACVDTALLLVVLRAVAGSAVGAFAVTLLFATAAPWRFGAVSETEGPAAALFLLAMVPAGALLAQARAQVGSLQRATERAWIGLAFAHMALGTVLVGLVRTELAGLGLAALCAAALLQWRDEAWLLTRLAAAWHRARALPRWAQAGLGVASVASLALLWLPGRIGWAVAGLHPANPSMVSLPLILLAFLPVGVVLLVVLGALESLRRPIAWLGLGAAVVVLYRIYFTASHRSFYEMLRYLALIWPALAILAAQGLAASARWLTARPRGWRRVAWTGLGLALLVPPVPPGAGVVWDWQPGALPLAGTLHTNHQRELRFLATTAERHPQCVLLTRVTSGDARLRGEEVKQYALFGASLPAPVHADPGLDLARAIARHAPEARCALFVRALDCHLVAGSSCEAEVAGMPLEHAERFASRPYNAPYEYGEMRSSIELAVFRVL